MTRSKSAPTRTRSRTKDKSSDVRGTEAAAATRGRANSVAQILYKTKRGTVPVVSVVPAADPLPDPLPAREVAAPQPVVPPVVPPQDAPAEADPDYLVELNKVLVKLKISKVGKSSLSGGRTDGMYTRDQIEAHVRKIMVDKGMTFEQDAFAAAFAGALASQKQQDEKQTYVEVYAAAAQKIPPRQPSSNSPEHHKENEAYKDFLESRSRVIAMLGADPKNTVVAYVDAGDNARRLAGYLGGLPVVEIGTNSLTNGQPLDPKFTNVIVYGHTTYGVLPGGRPDQPQPDTSRPLLGASKKVTPRTLAGALQGRRRVSVIGCDSETFVKQMQEKMAEQDGGKASFDDFVRTTAPFEWVKAKGKAPAFVHAWDKETKTSHGTLVNILKAGAVK